MKKEGEMNRFFAVFSAFAILGLWGSAAALEETPSTLRTISVEGSGEVSEEPDYCELDMGIRVLRERPVQGKNETDAILGKLWEVFRDFEIQKTDVEMSRIYVRPRFKTDRATQERNLVGYEVGRSVTVTFRDLDRVSELIGAAFAAGVNEHCTIYWKSTREKELQEQAIAEAAEDAKARAKRLAGQFGARLGKIFSIRYGEGAPIVRSSAMRVAMEEAQPFIPGKIEFKAQIHAVFELE
jgi:hypothetical protein